MRRDKTSGADLRYDLDLTLEEAFHGVAKGLEVPTMVICSSCHGSGLVEGSGSWLLKYKREACTVCGGDGRTTGKRNLMLNVPPGIEDGTQLRLMGEGEAGLRGGTKGNLYVLISIRKHLQFERDGADLKLSWPISSIQAERGDNINIPLIEGGMISLSVPAGTSINNVFRVPEKGMTILRSEKRGDMYVRFAIGVALPPQRKTGQIKLNDPAAFAGMRKAGRLVAECLDMLTKEIVPGVSGEKLDRRVVQFALDHGALPALLNYRGYTCASCISINHVVCHGVPNSLELREGDILSVCTAFAVDGWNARSTRMFTVGAVPARVERLVAVAYEAMMRGVSVVKPGVTTGDIGNAIQSFVESHHMSVVRDYCGSGIGRTLHDDPQIVHVGKPSEGCVLRPGMFFTIQPQINLGGPHVKVLSDGWTAVTRDRSLSAEYGHTLAVTETGVEIFTLSPQGLDKPT